jgi:ABC-type transport system involved in multi-copper enzyme maturation permease subunit
VRGALTIALYGLHEAVRRRAFVVVGLLTVAFLSLYALGTRAALREAEALGPADVDVIASATLLGLSMFGTLFLGAILAIFLTLGAVRGDAERGLLQQLLVRPVRRETFLAARLAGAAAVCIPYVLLVYGVSVVITNLAGGWMPDRLVRPGLELAAAVVVIASLSLLGSVFLSATANGIAAFMVVGAGMVAGLLGQIGEGINSETLMSVSTKIAWALPFEALYQDALHGLTADETGITAFVVQLGPFGGANDAPWELALWAPAFVGLVLLAAGLAFRRSDL